MSQGLNGLTIRLIRRRSSCTASDGAADEIQADRLELVKEKQILDEDRRMFNDAAVRFGQERRQLEVRLNSNMAANAYGPRQIERQAFLEEQRKVDVEAILALLPPTPPPGESTSEPVSVSTSAYASSSSWGAHRPLSPSPLSPSHPKNRSPRAHAAGRRRSVKTPLSRLVLEKAVRQKGRETAMDLVKDRLGALGDGSHRANVAKPDGLKSSTKGAVSLKSSVSGLETSVEAGVKRDLSKADDIGPRGVARGSKAWR